jgi:hypothetical protein
MSLLSNLHRFWNKVQPVRQGVYLIYDVKQQNLPDPIAFTEDEVDLIRQRFKLYFPDTSLINLVCIWFIPSNFPFIRRSNR